MIEGLGSLLSGLRANLASLNAAANNIANLNTDGYRERTVNLTIGPEGRGVRIASTSLNGQPGSIRTTADPLQVAIEGDSFLEARTADGPRFTRSGSLGLDADGFLATAEGDRLEPGIRIPSNATDLSIGRDGTVSGTVAGESVVFGRLQSVRFANAGGLESVGGNLFAASAASGEPLRGNFLDPGFGQLVPGALESSNSDLIGGIIDSILAQRSIQAQIAAIQTADEVLQESVNLQRPKGPFEI